MRTVSVDSLVCRLGRTSFSSRAAWKRDGPAPRTSGRPTAGPRRGAAERRGLIGIEDTVSSYTADLESPPRRVLHPSAEERRAAGRAARSRAASADHAGWEPAPDRPDPISLLEAQNATREPDLVPVRHGRMMVSPFTFYRGAAKIMAADLSATPTAGLDVQLCGDAHLSNFGVFASPERSLLVDLNDFDETLPGPFEYDVKRMAASFTIAGRNNGYTKRETRSATLASVAAYRNAMSRFAGMRTMDVWYAWMSEDDLMRAVSQQASRYKSKAQKRMTKTAAQTTRKAHTHDSVQALSKLAESVDGQYRIVSQPPIVVPVRELGDAYGMSPTEIENAIREQFRSYRETLSPDKRQLLERFEIVDVARKVVGVGSVGTRAFIALLQGRDQQDPLFLQVKEATSSVLEDYLPKSRYEPGERVVQGQRMMQAAGDIFLGWTKGQQENRFLYWRQLRDMKGSAVVEAMLPDGLIFYAGICGQTLARAHAAIGRSGRDLGAPREKGSVRSRDRRFLRALRRSERKGLPRVLRRRPDRPTRCPRRRLKARSRTRRQRRSARRLVRRFTPWATTAAVATVVAVRATGAGPMTAARRIRRRAIPISVSFFVIAGQRSGERLDRNSSARDELTAGMADRGGKRHGPGVLPDQHAGCGSGIDRRRNRLDVVLAQQHRELRLEVAQRSGLAWVELRQFDHLERPVVVLVQDHEVEHADDAAVDEIAQGRRDLAVEPRSRKLDHDIVDGPELVDVVRIRDGHASLPTAVDRPATFHSNTCLDLIPGG